MNSLAPALFVTTALLLGACGKKEEPESKSAAQPSESSRSAVPPVEPIAVSTDSRDERHDIEARIEAILEGDGDSEEMMALILDPAFSEKMEEMMEGWEPSEETQQRMMSAMQLMATIKAPDSQIAQSENLEDLDDSIGTVNFGTKDPELLRQMVRHVATRNPDGFFEMFSTAMEESAVETAVDSDAKTPIFFEVKPAPESADRKNSDR